MVGWGTRVKSRMGGAAQKLEVNIRGLTTKAAAEIGVVDKQVRVISADILKELSYEKQKRNLISGLANEVSKEVKELQNMRYVLMKDKAITQDVRAAVAGLYQPNAAVSQQLMKTHKANSEIHALIKSLQRLGHTGYEYRNTLISQKRLLEGLLKVTNDQLKWIGATEQMIAKATMQDKRLEAELRGLGRALVTQRNVALKEGHGRAGLPIPKRF